MFERTLSVLTIALLTGCAPGEGDDTRTHQQYEAGLTAAGLADSLVGMSWRSAAAEALSEPTAITLPYRENGEFFAYDARALGLAFNAVEGQRLSLSLRIDPESTGRLFVQVFYDPQDDRTPTEVAAIGAASDATVVLERDGRYVVRIQPELLATVIYELQIELEASLPFPVSGMDPQAVGSRFGDARDAGRRRHEGIDIFAPRMAPLVAVADGVATTRTNRLGGNTVWLRADGRRFYYAHLEQATFEGRRSVVAGDVLGYVGNSGNARTTPTHLHFGIYRGRRGAIDPMPYFLSYTYATVPHADAFVSTHVRTTASLLNLRAAPAIEKGNVLDKLPLGTLGRTLARSGDWLRLRTVDGLEGWIHARYQRRLPARIGTYSPPHPRLIYADPPAGRTEAIDRARARTALSVFAEHADALLVGLQPDEPLGWLRRTPDEELGGRMP